MMLDSARAAYDWGIDSVKYHPLYVVKQTLLAHEYRRGEFTPITQEEYDALKEKNHASAADGLSAIFDKYEIDVLLADTQEYAPAGFPAITVPLGYDPNSGQPIPLMLIGDYLGEPKLITAAYISEQASQARQEPDLETTIQQIQEAVGK